MVVILKVSWKNTIRFNLVIDILIRITKIWTYEVHSCPLKLIGSVKLTCTCQWKFAWLTSECFKRSCLKGFIWSWWSKSNFLNNTLRSLVPGWKPVQPIRADRSMAQSNKGSLNTLGYVCTFYPFMGLKQVTVQPTRNCTTVNVRSFRRNS